MRPEPGTEICTEAFFLPVTTVSSTIVFHSPHAGQRPIHLGLSFPHDLQNHTFLDLEAAIQFVSVRSVPQEAAAIIHKDR